jgi:hypothetical protein
MELDRSSHGTPGRCAELAPIGQNAPMSFLDKAKEKATQLTQQAKEKIDDLKDNRKADDLLDELGRITYRQHTDRAETGDSEAIATLVGQLQALEADGTPVLGSKEEREQAANLPPPTAPLPPPPMPT